MAYNDFYEDNMDKYVMFVIGSREAEQTFLVNRDLALMASPVFRAAFTGPWIESRAGTMIFRDIDPELFGFVIHWMYSGGYVEDWPVVHFFEGACTGTPSEQLVKYGRLWMIGDKLGMPDLQNVIGTILRRNVRNKPLAALEQFMNLTYNQNSEGETYLLEQILRFKFYLASGEELRDCPYSIHPELIRALIEGKDNGEFSGVEARWNQYGLPPYNPTQGVIDWSLFAEDIQEDAYPNPVRRRRAATM